MSVLSFVLGDMKGGEQAPGFFALGYFFFFFFSIVILALGGDTSYDYIGVFPRVPRSWSGTRTWHAGTVRVGWHGMGNGECWLACRIDDGWRCARADLAIQALKMIYESWYPIKPRRIMNMSWFGDMSDTIPPPGSPEM